ncbi:MAG: hypothetical protein DRH12_19110 [Deltaproteobacteria bacterium]|nr:MAG: hypothetical protein DRH12_19110 [Deltaproteobacteria bacterium]
MLHAWSAFFAFDVKRWKENRGIGEIQGNAGYVGDWEVMRNYCSSLRRPYSAFCLYNPLWNLVHADPDEQQIQTSIFWHPMNFLCLIFACDIVNIQAYNNCKK